MRTIAEFIPTEGWLADWCEYLSGRVMAPPEFILASGLAALSAGIGNTVWFRLGAKRWPHLWLLLMAPAGARKSTPATYAEAAIEIARGETGMLPRRFTPEAFYGALERSPDGIWYAGEFASFVDASRRRDYMAGARADLCDIWDGGRFTRVTRKDKVTVRDCAPTALATGRESDFEHAAGMADFSSGFMSRWLVIAATDPGGYVGLDADTGGPAAEDAAMKRLCQHLWDLRGTFGAWDAEGLLTRSTRARISPEARALHARYDEPWGREAVSDVLAGWGARRGIYAAKLAVLHAISRSTRPKVEAADMAWAIAIVKVCWTGVLELTEDRIGLSETARNRKRVFELGVGLAGNNGHPVKIRDWVRRVQHYVRDMREFEQMLAVWEESGRVKIQEIEPTRGRRYRVAWFEHQEAIL